MKITLCDRKENPSLIVQFQDKTSDLSVESQKGVIFKYASDLSLVRLEVRDGDLIKPILAELMKMLDNPDIQIIRKVA